MLCLFPLCVGLGFGHGLFAWVGFNLCLEFCWARVAFKTNVVVLLLETFSWLVWAVATPWFCVCVAYVLALGWAMSCLHGWVDFVFEGFVGLELRCNKILGVCSWKLSPGWAGLLLLHGFVYVLPMCWPLVWP